jgi:hypothetical protein
MRKLISVLGVGLLFTATNAIAQEEEGAAAEAPAEAAAEEVKEGAEEVKEEVKEATTSPGGAGYGSAGCGLGSLLFEPSTGFTQVLAATTNGTSGSQTFGITSGTSNCDSGPGSSASAKAFVQTNRAAIAKDIARGKGETISNLSALAGCSNTVAVGSKLQREFKTIFPSASVSDAQVSEKVVSVLKSEQSLSCSNLI